MKFYKKIEMYSKYIIEKKLNGRVIICGHQNHSKVPLFLKACDILVIPNTSKDEFSKDLTSPIKLFEYMASNRPIIASNVPSIRNIIDENCAVFFEPDYSKELSDSIITLINDKKKSIKLAQNALKKARTFSWFERAKNIKMIISKK